MAAGARCRSLHRGPDLELARAAIRAGTADERCREIAERLDDEDGIVGVEVALETHDVVARVAGDESLLDRTVHATCEVGA